MGGKGETGKEDRGKIVDLRLQIGDLSLGLPPIGRVPSFAIRNYSLLGTNVAQITKSRDKYTAPRGRVELLDPLLAAVELV